MSCRTRRSSSAVTTLARLQSGVNGTELEDVQVLSLYHSLLRDSRARADQYARMGSHMQPPTEAAWHNFLDNERHRAQQLYGAGQISEARFRSITRRLDDARNEEIPDWATFRALQTLRSTSVNRGRALQGELAYTARRLGITEEEATARYREYVQSIDRDRTARSAPLEGYSNEAALSTYRQGLPSDRGSVYALARLRNDIRVAHANTAATRPPRVVMEPVLYGNGRITQLGFDHDADGTGRLELVTVAADGQEVHSVYRNVPDTWVDRLRSDVDGSAWTEFSRNVRGNPDYQYEDALEATIDGAVRRCRGCGQFANSQHQCPTPSTGVNSLRRYSDYRPVSRTFPNGAQYDGPGTTVVAHEARRGPIRFPATVAILDTDGGGSVSGSVTIDRTTDRANPTLTLSNVQCNCRTYRDTGDCPHIDAAVTGLRAGLLEPSASAGGSGASTPAGPLTEEDIARAQRAAETALARDYTRDEAQMAAARARFAADQEVSYSDNPDKFLTAVDEALARKEAGVPAVPYEIGDNVLPLAPDGSRRTFGVELEYSFRPGTDVYRANRQIAKELHEAGLTSVDHMRQYGFSKRNGPFTDLNGGWSLESDPTVSGELVTPIMTDTPEAWEKLQTALDILRRNGAVPSKKAGAHVHMNTSTFGSDAGKARELLRLYKQHEDVLYRVAQNPAARTHRGLRYAAANPAPPENYRTMSDVQSAAGGRYRALNYAHIAKQDNGQRVEFRLWDASLDPGVVQAQIKMSAAMANAAERGAALPTSNTDKYEVRGSHKVREEAAKSVRRRGRSAEVREMNETAAKAVGADRLADSASTRAFADILFSREKDKAQFAALWAVTNWQS